MASFIDDATNDGTVSRACLSIQCWMYNICASGYTLKNYIYQMSSVQKIVRTQRKSLQRHWYQFYAIPCGKYAQKLFSVSVSALARNTIMYLGCRKHCPRRSYLPLLRAHSAAKATASDMVDAKKKQPQTAFVWTYEIEQKKQTFSYLIKHKYSRSSRITTQRLNGSKIEKVLIFGICAVVRFNVLSLASIWLGRQGDCCVE